jgi:hypothetical protein
MREDIPPKAANVVVSKSMRSLEVSNAAGIIVAESSVNHRISLETIRKTAANQQIDSERLPITGDIGIIERQRPASAQRQKALHPTKSVSVHRERRSCDPLLLLVN